LIRERPNPVSRARKLTSASDGIFSTQWAESIDRDTLRKVIVARANVSQDSQLSSHDGIWA